MEHPLFKPTNIEQAKNMSVGACKGLSMQQRWDEETPVFAEAILNLVSAEASIVDYGCGPGRIAKAVIDKATEKRWKELWVLGVDDSPEMLEQANQYVEGGDWFTTCVPREVNAPRQADLVYSVYCLQHMPAIEIRDALERIWNHLKDTGLFFYCSSENRMAARFDDGGFFDDRFLGVDLIAEVSRFFDYVGPAIPEELMNDTVRQMVSGEHAHPATLWRKKKIKRNLFNATPASATSIWLITHTPSEVMPSKVSDNATSVTESVGEPVIEPASHIQQSNLTATAGSPTKLILQNRLSPGDILVMSSAIRALHQAYPGEYLTDVRSPCTNIYENSPYLTPLDENASDVTVVKLGKVDKNGNLVDKFTIQEVLEQHASADNLLFEIDMHYPEIHFSGQSGRHFSDGHRMFLAEQIGKPISQNGIQPDLFLSEAEKRHPLVEELSGWDGDYIVLDAGYKNDYSLKRYFFYQEVVDLLAARGIKCVQVGLLSPEHTHPILKGTINLLGKTDNVRDLFSVIYNADVVITPVSFPMHIAAALKKPCVVVALGREAPRWEYYPNHRYLTVNGALPCCSYDGCWRNTIADCVDLVDTASYGKVPHCQLLIPPQMIVDATMMYYEGGMMKPVELSLKNTVERKPTTPSNEAVLQVLRDLKGYNPGDPYLENYQGHIAKWGDRFYDIYHFIWEWFSEHAPRRILEIGTWTGDSLGQMLRAHPAPESIELLITCDLFDRAETNPSIVQRNMLQLGITESVVNRIGFLMGKSQEEIPESLPEYKQFDFILVDGAHYPPELPRRDLDNCAPLVAKDGVIVMDDLAPDGMNLDAIWQAWKADQDANWEFFENYDGKGFGYGVRK